MFRIYLSILFLTLSFFSIIVKADDFADLPKEFIKPNSEISLNDANFFDQEGNLKNLELFENRILIVHFWASWLMDCQKDLIALNDLQKKLRKKPVLVIAISEDFLGVEKVNEFYSKHNIDFLDIYVDKKNKIMGKLEIKHLPVTYIINEEGKVIAQTKPGKNINWDDNNVIKFIEDNSKFYKLLPPEYKKTRTSYLGQNTVK